ncbi:MAG: hypothetical protein M3P32_04490, partial [Chloroflexota bacterium]|nr:hypothetical protein [Chloroflexota bacterium]
VRPTTTTANSTPTYLVVERSLRPGLCGMAGEEGFEPSIIQSLSIGIRLASRDLSVRRAAIGHRIGVSQVPTPK